MTLKTSNLAFKQRVDEQIHNEIMRKAIVMAQGVLALIVKIWQMN